MDRAAAVPDRGRDGVVRRPLTELSCAAALDAADRLLGHLPADQEPVCQLAAGIIRLTAALRTGDLATAAPAAASAELLLGQIPGGKLARHPDISGRVLSGRGAVELWSGHLDEAASLLDAAMAAATASGWPEPADYVAYLALAEAWRGRLRRAARSPSRTHGRPPETATRRRER